MEKTHTPLYRSLHQCCSEWQVVKQNKDEMQLRAGFEFSASFAGFAGHFPGRPILPAIVQLGSVRVLAELALKRPLLPLSYSRTKFRGIIQADEKIEVQLQLKRDGNLWAGTFFLQDLQGERIAQGGCTFSI